MAEYEIAVPVVLAGAGYFHYLLARLFASQEAHKPLVWLWLGIGYLFIVDSLFAVHLVASDPVLFSYVTATRVGYLLGLGSFCFTCLYLLVMGIKESISFAAESGRRWMR